MSFRVLSVISSLLVCAFASAAQADMLPGGVFQKIDGAHYSKSAGRSNLGAGVGNATAWQPQAQVKAPKVKYTKTYASPKKHAGVGPRPGKWCGWWMRTQLGGGPHLNVAWNWRNYGRATSPQVGAVVVWRHHVGMITGRTADGRWIVKSGNDGGKVRERARSVKGAVFRI